MICELFNHSKVPQAINLLASLLVYSASTILEDCEKVLEDCEKVVCVRLENLIFALSVLVSSNVWRSNLHQFHVEKLGIFKFPDYSTPFDSKAH